MAFVERVRGENFVIFAGNETKENSENVGPMHGKGSHLAARAPLQDRTLSMQNASKVQPCRPSKQQVRVLSVLSFPMVQESLKKLRL
jgi:hypothetical protein